MSRQSGRGLQGYKDVRHADFDRGPLSRRRVGDDDIPAEKTAEASSDGKSQPGAITCTRKRFIHLGERFEDSFHLIRGNPNSFVTDTNDDLPGVVTLSSSAGADADGAVRCEPLAVAEPNSALQRAILELVFPPPPANAI